MTGKIKVTRPRDYLEFKITQFMSDISGGSLGVGDDFFENGGTSLGALQLLQLIESELGVQLVTEDFIEAPNAEALARLVRNDASEYLPRRNLVRIGSDTGALRLYLVHGRGGEVFAYEPLRGAGLRATIRAVRAVGCDHEAPPLSTFSEMAEHYVNLILDDCPTGPILVGGFCLGAGIALEVVRRLHELQRPVERLLAFDSILSGRAYRGTERDLMLSGRHPELAGLVRTGIPQESFDLEKDSWEQITTVLKDLGRLPAGSDSEVIATRLQLIGHILVAWGDYRPAPMTVPVSAIYGDEYTEAVRAKAFAEWRMMSPEAAYIKVEAEHEKFFSSFETAEAIREVLGSHG